jgi:hypothetical protein
MVRIGQKIWIAMAFFLFSAITCASVVIAQVVVDTVAKTTETVQPWWVESLQSMIGSFPEFNAWLIAILAFSSVFLRGLSELMAFIAAKTETKSDDKWAEIIAKGAWGSAALFGWFGGGKSKKLIERQLEKETPK